MKRLTNVVHGNIRSTPWKSLSWNEKKHWSRQIHTFRKETESNKHISRIKTLTISRFYGLNLYSHCSSREAVAGTRASVKSCFAMCDVIGSFSEDVSDVSGNDFHTAC